jgi:monoamine oxidase
VDRQPDVLIIGAGIAGLAAARILAQKRIFTVIFEARDRIGGRIHTIDDPLSPLPVELGAEFVHGKPPQIWRAIESGRLAAVERTGDQLSVREGRVRPDAAEWERVEELLARAAQVPDQPFQQFLESSGADEKTRRAALGYAEGFNAARQDQLSTRFVGLSQEAGAKIEGDRIFRILGGYRNLVADVWKSIDPEMMRIHLGSVVESVHWRRGQVEISARVSGRPQRFYAPRAIITAPMGVLQQRSIRFEPEPANLRAAREAIAMGDAIRMVLRFRRPVWENREKFRNFSFATSDEDWMPTWWTMLPVHAPVITGWTGGTRAEAWRSADAQARLAGSLRTLGRMLRTDETTLAGELESWHTHDWHADPFSRGAYSYLRPGGLEAQRGFGEPVQDTLYFAGEAVNAEGHAGTVHGAMATGECAARRIAALMPQ